MAIGSRKSKSKRPLVFNFLETKDHFSAVFNTPPLTLLTEEHNQQHNHKIEHSQII